MCDVSRDLLKFWETSDNHRLRGSASPVLTTTDFVNGKGQFSTPTESTPLTDHQKICHRWLRRRPLRLCQIRCLSVHGGHLGTWVKYNHLYLFLRNSPTVQTHRRIFTHDGSNDAVSRKDVPFLKIFHIAPNLVGQKTQKPPILGRE